MSIPETSVLLVVDAQRGFVNSKSQHVVPVIADLVRRWQAAGGDTVFSRYFNFAGSPFERLVRWTAMRSGPATDIIPELQQYADRSTAVVDKTTYTALADTGRQLVAAHGWTDLYLCGIDTECCVLTTAVDAFEMGLTPWLIADASASTGGTESHEAGLLVARRSIGRRQVIDTADVPVPTPLSA